MADELEREQRALVAGILEQCTSELQSLPGSAAKRRALSKVSDIAAELGTARRMLGDFKTEDRHH